MKSPLRLVSFIVLRVVTFAIIHEAESLATKHVKIEDALEGPEYALLIDKDEERRLSELLQHDFHELGLIGTYTTGPPQVCPRCGKETEFIDWVFTALERGVHTREWLVEALREGRTGEKTAHDVYCSHCGHLTAFQDHTGAEGRVHDISQANPYDHAAKLFGYQARAPREEATWDSNFVAKRETGPNALLESADELAGSEVPDDSDVIDKPLGWVPRNRFWDIRRNNAPDYIVKRANELAREG